MSVSDDGNKRHRRAGEELDTPEPPGPPGSSSRGTLIKAARRRTSVDFLRAPTPGRGLAAGRRGSIGTARWRTGRLACDVSFIPAGAPVQRRRWRRTARGGGSRSDLRAGIVGNAAHPEVMRATAASRHAAPCGSPAEPEVRHAGRGYRGAVAALVQAVESPERPLSASVVRRPLPPCARGAPPRSRDDGRCCALVPGIAGFRGRCR